MFILYFSSLFFLNYIMSNVILSIDAQMSSDCKTIKFFEKTGPYGVSNTSGWGSPNETIADVNTAEITITTPADNSYTFDSNSLTPFYSDWPTSDTSAFYAITSDMIGYGTNQKLPDGLYRIYYEVVTNTTTYTQVKDFLFYGNAQCCVFNLFADIDYECDCSKSKIENAKKAYLMLKGLESASTCLQKSYFNDLLEDLEKICTGNCTNC